MYQPEDRAQLLDILADLQTFAELEGMAGVSETLSDALLLVAAEIRSERQAAGGGGAPRG